MRSLVAWLGDRLPDPLGSWLLRFSDDSKEPWVDAEGRSMLPPAYRPGEGFVEQVGEWRP
jgi:hypothetical protein